jgi:hypothetical protein
VKQQSLTFLWPAAEQKRRQVPQQAQLLVHNAALPMMQLIVSAIIVALQFKMRPK